MRRLVLTLLPVAFLASCGTGGPGAASTPLAASGGSGPSGLGSWSGDGQAPVELITQPAAYVRPFLPEEADDPPVEGALAPAEAAVAPTETAQGWLDSVFTVLAATRPAPPPPPPPAPAPAPRASAPSRPAAPSGGSPAPAAPSSLGGVLACIRQHESGGNYGAVNPSGTYRGAYQFDQRTWEAVGGSGDPAAASPAEQDRRAAILYQQRGGQPWPNARC